MTAMGRGFDIRGYKKALRNRYRAVRQSLSPAGKEEKDGKILENLLDLPAYRECGTLLTYVSTSEEIDTRKLIRRALDEGKRVAVPRCVSGTRRMDFYLIRSLDELVPRTFGVLEPVAEDSKKLADFAGSLCILPGIVFDRFGYRLGYGGGYYDRFLLHAYRGSGGKTAGVCYCDCFVSHLHHGRFDVPCGIIVTEKGAKYAIRPPTGWDNSRNRRHGNGARRGKDSRAKGNEQAPV